MKKPLTQPMYYILLSLWEERHGYEIMQYVSWLTDDQVTIGPGTLYSLLGRFEEDGQIKMVSDQDKRKTYLITDKGKKLLNNEIDRLEFMLVKAKKVKEGRDDKFQNRD